MRHYLYKITNTCNAKIYIGVHSCEGEFLDSCYYGSGVAITRAVVKYGTHAFSREVLQEYSSRRKVMEAEAKVVTTNFIEQHTNYNLITGGQGQVPNEETRKKMGEAASNRPPISEETRKKISDNSRRMAGNPVWKQNHSKRMLGKNNPFYGKAHTEETCERIASKQRGKVFTAEHRKNLANAQNKRIAEGRGFIEHSAEAKRKISEAQKGVKLIERVCPYCGLVGRGGNMKRYHFDNCKLKGAVNG